MLTIAPSFVEFYVSYLEQTIYFVYAAKKEIGNGYRKSENVSGCCLFSIGFNIQLNDYIYILPHIFWCQNLHSIVPKDHSEEMRREVGFFVFPFIQWT